MGLWKLDVIRTLNCFFYTWLNAIIMDGNYITKIRICSKTFVRTAVCLSPQEMETVFLRLRESTVTGVDLSEDMI